MAEKVQWFAASVILYFKFKTGSQREFPVWENVYLIRARSPSAARRRAESLGRAEALVDGVEWNGKPASLVYGGIRKVVSCAANPATASASTVSEIHDGTEATYSQYTVTSTALKALIAGEAATVRYDE